MKKRPDIVPTQADSDSPSTGAAAETPPFSVPDHTLIRRVGKGSYGEVWLARNALGTWRAVKIVRRSAFDDDRPYEREFAGIQRFEPISRSHESQLNILQVGRAEGAFYYVMEVADEMGRGQDIDPGTYTPRNLRSELHLHGRLPAADCLRIGLALTTALEHLHKHGLVHRDIKPSNIVFVNGIPKLADIGLVAHAEATMSFVGTEGFIPPEGPGTRPADIYSLGKVLYELSTGHDRQQFPELPTNIADLPDRPLLGELNEVLIKACHRDPAQRYQTAAEMHADLALLESGRSVVRMRGMERRLRLVQRAGAIVTALAAVVALGWWWQTRQTRVVRELATQMTRLAQEKTALAAEKTELAGNLERVAEENRQRILRRDIASGVKLLDEGDPAGALLWFTDALPLVTNRPTEEAIHRIRIQQTLNQIPRLLQVFPHGHTVTASAFSEDGRRIVTGTDQGYLRVWDAQSGGPLWEPLALSVSSIAQTRFTRDGQRVFASSLPSFGFFAETRLTNIAAIIEVETGRQLVFLSVTNLVRADLSPDERWLVTADTDHVIRVHDARDGKPISAWQAHTNRILQFHSRTNILATRSDDHTIRFWRLPSGEPLGSAFLFDHGPIDLSQDGTLLATARVSREGATNSAVQFWEVQSGASVGSPIEVQGTAEAVWFVSGAEHTLFVMTDKVCGLFDSGSHQQLLKPVSRPSGAPIFSVSPDGRCIAFGASGGLEGVWSLETGERLLPPCLAGRPLTDVNFSPDGSQLLASSDNGTATLLSSGHLLEDASYRFDTAMEKRPPTVMLEWNRFSPDRRYFLHILTDRTVRLVDFEKMTDQRIPADQFKGLNAIQSTFDTSGRRGAIYYSGGDTHLVEIWKEDGHITNRFVLPLSADLSDKLLFTPDGSRLITPGRDGQIRFWRTSDGTLERSLALPEELTGGTLFPDGRTAFAVHREEFFALFDVITGSITKTPMPPFGITAFRFNSLGDRFASAGLVNWSRVWSTRTGEPLTPPLDHGGEVRWVDWRPDNQRLLTAGLTPEVRVWDATTGEQLLAPLRLGSKPLETAQWSLDGRFIVARSDENSVRVWDAATGEPVTPILQHSDYVRLAHLVANNRLVTLSLPNLMRAWDLKECRLPVDVVSDYAKLASGRRRNAAGVMLPLCPEEQAELCRSLRLRAPQLFD